MPVFGAFTLSEHSTAEDRKVWAVNGHSVTKPKIVIQTRKAPSGVDGNAVQTSTFKVVYGTVDPDSVPMQGKVNVTVEVRYPQGALATDVDEAIDVLQAIVAHAQMDTFADTQTWFT